MLDYLRSVRITRLRICIWLLADQALVVHSALALAAVVWSLVIGQVGLAAAAIIMWLCAGMIWIEFKNGGCNG